MFHLLKKLTGVFPSKPKSSECSRLLHMANKTSFSFLPVRCFESFLDEEFAKAQRDLDTDTLDAPEALLQKLERDQKRRIQATKRARAARLFQPSKEPRSISWDTIEQIRYLKQENGDEWTTKNLAASFGIKEALVVKVLKSKFVPTRKRQWKQDERAKVNAGLLERTSRATGPVKDSSRWTQKKTLLLELSTANQTNVTTVVRSPHSNFKSSSKNSED